MTHSSVMSSLSPFLCFALNYNVKKWRNKNVLALSSSLCNYVVAKKKTMTMCLSASLWSSSSSCCALSCNKKNKNNVGKLPHCHPLHTATLHQNNKWQWCAWAHQCHCHPLYTMCWVATRKKMTTTRECSCIITLYAVAKTNDDDARMFPHHCPPLRIVTL